MIALQSLSLASSDLVFIIILRVAGAQLAYRLCGSLILQSWHLCEKQAELHYLLPSAGQGHPFIPWGVGWADTGI